MNTSTWKYGKQFRNETGDTIIVLLRSPEDIAVGYNFTHKSPERPCHEEKVV